MRPYKIIQIVSPALGVIYGLDENSTLWYFNSNINDWTVYGQ